MCGNILCTQVMSKCCACKFLYGATTSPDDIIKLENALETQTEFKTEAEFYRRNGPCLASSLSTGGRRFGVEVMVESPSRRPMIGP